MWNNMCPTAFRGSAIRRTEDEDETDMIREALAEFRADPRTFSFDEEMGRLGLSEL